MANLNTSIKASIARAMIIDDKNFIIVFEFVLFFSCLPKISSSKYAFMRSNIAKERVNKIVDSNIFDVSFKLKFVTTILFTPK